jgi:hypothetical protein
MGNWRLTQNRFFTSGSTKIIKLLNRLNNEMGKLETDPRLVRFNKEPQKNY